MAEQQLSWESRVEEALERREFTSDDEADAMNWMCCAVGQTLCLNEVFEDDTNANNWLDEHHPEMRDLGVEFYNAVSRNEPQWAKYLLSKIQRLHAESEVELPDHDIYAFCGECEYHYDECICGLCTDCDCYDCICEDE